MTSISREIPWPNALFNSILNGCPSRPAFVSGHQSLSYCTFLSISILIRDELIRIKMQGDSRVLMIYSDTSQHRLTFACTATAFAMLRVPFTLLDGAMPRRAREHVVNVFKPDLFVQLLDPCDANIMDLLPGNAFNLPRIVITIDPILFSHKLHVHKCQWSHSSQDHSPQCSFSSSDDWSQFVCASAVTISVDTVLGGVSSGPCADGKLWCLARSDDIAFADWTSGSSGGLPKGVYCRHSTLSNMFCWKWSKPLANEVPLCQHQETWSSIGVNLFGLWYWWQPVCVGLTSALILSSEIRDLQLLFAGMRRMNVRVLDCITPSLLQIMLALYRAELTSLHFPEVIIVSGEALSLTCAQEFHTVSNNNGMTRRLLNLYSTTETGDAAMFEVTSTAVEQLQLSHQTLCPIGEAIDNVDLILTDTEGLIVAGVNSHEYICDVEATALGFDSRGWLSHDQAVQLVVDGRTVISLCGRLDDCVKIRGFKVDLRAVEECVLSSGCVVSAAAVNDPNSDSLIVFVVFKVGSVSVEAALANMHSLPESHLPQVVERLAEFPKTRTGKIDRNKLLADYFARRVTAHEVTLACDTLTLSDSSFERDLHERVRQAWLEVLGENKWNGNLEADFWACGGHSLAAIHLCARLGIPSSKLLDGTASSPASMVQWLRTGGTSVETIPSQVEHPLRSTSAHEPIAVIGMSGRWPGIGQTTTDALVAALSAGFEPLSTAPHPSGLGNIKKGFYLDESLIRGFDLSFWRVHQKEAAGWDPHIRMFAEIAYEALCDAGVNITPPGLTSQACHCGVFASGGSLPHYLDQFRQPGESLSYIRASDPARYLDMEIGNDKDYMASRTAYLLNLIGPAETIQTACSSGLVSIARAVDALRAGRCDIAVTGGVSIVLPQNEHAFTEGLIWSEDGRCRPFDENASGTASSNGAAAFVLKPLSVAIADGDPIYACIRGVAVNNDGRDGKQSYTAPSPDGHARAISAALGDAAISPDKVSMVEAHATGTVVGDPLEVEAIVKAYGKRSSVREDGDGSLGYLSLGSVKGNIGHANTAAGSMSFAKTVASIYSGIVFPSGNFKTISKLVAAALSHSERDMRVQTMAMPWHMLTTSSRVAGVSALGIGGTNAHVVVEQHHVPDQHNKVACSGQPSHVRYLVLSATSSGGLVHYSSRLAEYVMAKLDSATLSVSSFVDRLAITLGCHRPELPVRVSIPIPSDIEKMTLASHISRHVSANVGVANPRCAKSVPVVLLFGGQGIRLHSDKSVCIHQGVIEILGYDPVLRYRETRSPVDYQLALFSLQYSIGQQVIEQIAGPKYAVGLSLGEWAVATLVGVLTLAEALQCVRKRAELLTLHCSVGDMLSVAGSPEDIERIMTKLCLSCNLEIACVNRSDRVVLSGSKDACEIFSRESGLECVSLGVDCAFHSRFFDVAIKEFREFVALTVQTRPISSSNEWHVISSSLGRAVDLNTLASADYWVAQTRGKVNFVDCVTVVQNALGNEFVWLDCGPGRVMKSLVAHTQPSCVCVSKSDEKSEEEDSTSPVNRALMQVWEAGGNINLRGVIRATVYDNSLSRLLSLPPYTWDRTDCWAKAVASSISPVFMPAASDNVQNTQSETDAGSALYYEAWDDIDLGLTMTDTSCATRGAWIDWKENSTEGICVCNALGFTFSETVHEAVALLRETGLLVINYMSEGCGEKSVSECIAISQAEATGHFLGIIQAVLSDVSSLRALARIGPWSSIRGSICVLLPHTNGVYSGGVVGAARCACHEHPELNIRIVHFGLNTDTALEGAERLCRLITSQSLPQGEFQVTKNKMAFRRFKPLGVVSANTIADEDLWSALGIRGGTVVISGGLGGLGCVVAAWAVARGASRVLLLTRKKHALAILPPELSELSMSNIPIISIASDVDITDITSLRKALFDVSPTCVFHCAGEVFDSLVRHAPVDPATLLHQMSSKTLGLENMMNVIDEKCTIIAFSSSSGALGLHGQAVYAAANAAMDAIIAKRSNGFSVQWGGWSSGIRGSMGERYGVVPVGSSERFFSASRGLQVLEIFLHHAVLKRNISRVCMAADISDWDSYCDLVGISRPLLAHLLEHSFYTLSMVDDMKHFPLRIPCEAKLQVQSDWIWLRDHVADGQVLLPATAMLEIIAGKHFTEVKAVTFAKPVRPGTVLMAVESPQHHGVTISTSEGVFVFGAVERVPVSHKSSETCAALCVAAALSTSVWIRESREDIYVSMRTGGFNYGNSFALVSGAARSSGRDVALGVVNNRRSGLSSSEYAPELDACTHICGLLHPMAYSSYPVSVGVFRIHRPGSNEMKRQTQQLCRDFDLLQDSNLDHNDVWITICRKNPEGIELEFDLLCIRLRDGLEIVLQKLKLQHLPRPTPLALCLRLSSDVQVLPAVSHTTPVKHLVDLGPVAVSVNEEFAPTFSPLSADRMVKPPPGHISIAVRMFALNFLDILAATGAMPSSCFGGECVGIVKDVGEDVTSFSPGDRVAAVLLGGFESFVCVRSEFACLVPEGVSNAEAVTIPLAYTTAWLALKWQGHIQNATSSGVAEKVLIHSAAGGVGLACVNLVLSHGGRVIATCSPGKESALVAMGVDRGDIFPSRDIAQWSAGCLSLLVGQSKLSLCVGAFVGESLERSLELMAPFGRVLDVGKAEQAAGQSIPMSHFLRGLSYSAAHVDELMRECPDLMRRLHSEVWTAFGCAVKPLPMEVFALRDIQLALRRLASGDLIGKVVIEMPNVSMHADESVPIIESLVSTDCNHCSVEHVIAAMRKYMLTLDLNPAALSSLGAKIEIKPLHVNESLPLTNASYDQNQKEKECSRVYLAPDIDVSIAQHAQAVAMACITILFSSSAPADIIVLTESALSGAVPREYHDVASELFASYIHHPVNGVHDWLVRYLCEATGLDRHVAETRSLEELGFDSLGRLKIVHKIRHEFPYIGDPSAELGRQVPLAQLFCHASVEVDVESTDSRASPVRSQRWLALHGFRTNPSVLKKQMSALVDFASSNGLELSFDYMAAPHLSSAPGEADLVSALSDESEGYEWWYAADGDSSFEKGWIGSEGFTQSLDYLTPILESEEYHGVIGMSQGGGMAFALVMSGLVRRAILLSPVGPLQGPDTAIFTAASTLDSSTTSVLTFWDASDGPTDDFIREVVLKSGVAGTFVKHNYGHTVPQRWGQTSDADGDLGSQLLSWLHIDSTASVSSSLQ